MRTSRRREVPAVPMRRAPRIDVHLRKRVFSRAIYCCASETNRRNAELRAWAEASPRRAGIHRGAHEVHCGNPSRQSLVM